MTCRAGPSGWKQAPLRRRAVPAGDSQWVVARPPTTARHRRAFDALGRAARPAGTGWQACLPSTRCPMQAIGRVAVFLRRRASRGFGRLASIRHGRGGEVARRAVLAARPSAASAAAAVAADAPPGPALASGGGFDRPAAGSDDGGAGTAQGPGRAAAREAGPAACGAASKGAGAKTGSTAAARTLSPPPPAPPAPARSRPRAPPAASGPPQGPGAAPCAPSAAARAHRAMTWTRYFGRQPPRSASPAAPSSPAAPTDHTARFARPAGCPLLHPHRTSSCSNPPPPAVHPGGDGGNAALQRAGAIETVAAPSPCISRPFRAARAAPLPSVLVCCTMAHSSDLGDLPARLAPCPVTAPAAYSTRSPPAGLGGLLLPPSPPPLPGLPCCALACRTVAHQDTLPPRPPARPPSSSPAASLVPPHGRAAGAAGPAWACPVDARPTVVRVGRPRPAATPFAYATRRPGARRTAAGAVRRRARTTGAAATVSLPSRKAPASRRSGAALPRRPSISPAGAGPESPARNVYPSVRPRRQAAMRPCRAASASGGRYA